MFFNDMGSGRWRKNFQWKKWNIISPFIGAFSKRYTTFFVSLQCMSKVCTKGKSYIMADSRFAPSQWETALLCNDVSHHWLGANLEPALYVMGTLCTGCNYEYWICCYLWKNTLPHTARIQVHHLHRHILIWTLMILNITSIKVGVVKDITTKTGKQCKRCEVKLFDETAPNFALVL